MKRRQPEVGAGLVLKGRKNINTNLVTEMIGLRPTFHSRQPDSLITERAEWRYDRFPDPGDSASPVVRTLLTQLTRYRARILKAMDCFGLKASIQLFVNHTGNEPDYLIGPELLGQILKYRAGLDSVVRDLRLP